MSELRAPESGQTPATALKSGMSGTISASADPPAVRAARLSRRQQNVLVYIYRRWQQEIRDANGSDWALGQITAWGVRIYTAKATRSQQASFCRSLKRLEERGLILRQNQAGGPGRRDSAAEPHTRRTHVKLLPPGRELAKRLTQAKSRHVNQNGGGHD